MNSLIIPICPTVQKWLLYLHGLLVEGIYISPSQLELQFLGISQKTICLSTFIMIILNIELISSIPVESEYGTLPH